MKSKIRFLTLHPEGTNVDLVKDEGQIPYTLSKMGVEATLVTSYINKKTANLDTVKGLKVKHFPFIINSGITGIIYIFLHAKQIDWLNFYFAGRKALWWAKLYKFLNSKGKIYLKLDMDYRSCDLYDRNLKERQIFYKCTKIVDIVSIESESIKNRIQKYSDKNLLVIRDGVAEIYDKNINITSKMNLFITVARLGTMQKATDILLNAFALSAEYHNWNLLLIGNIENDFKDYIEKFFEKFPSMVNRVIFAGSISDRNKLYDNYCKSKVFVLPSRWESFGISAVEALSCGCRLILSDQIPPACEMTNNWKYGFIVEKDNIDDLTNKMIEMTKYDFNQEEINEMVTYAKQEFSWEGICEILYLEMSKLSLTGDC